MTDSPTAAAAAAPRFRFLRSDWRLPPAQLLHVDLSLRFFEDRVEGAETLFLEARERIETLRLDAQALEVGPAFFAAGASRDAASGEFVPVSSLFDKRANSLVLALPEAVEPGGRFAVRLSAVCHPSENVLDGIYRDVTPPGAPRQYVSQCQQWGFQRIMPIIDDCTAKCTWRTELEGDARYTHLISNGDVDRASNPRGVPEPVPDDPSRIRVAYVNSIPMPPYLFIAAAGTWDVLRDSVRTPGGREIALEYLVPPGRLDGARLPMEILKDSVLFQARHVGYEYARECYRTICMEKSNFGGMENVGNTTIVTEAALLDEWTPDRRVFYAFGVIVHEFEHSHCGSDVTMRTPFDMWLNEAFTVTVEQAYQAERFGDAFARLDALDGIRDPMRGPLAQEDGGSACFPIVRDGFDSPDDVVDGVTYDKAPEVLGMLRELVGRDNYEASMRAYFARHAGGNVETADFLAAFGVAAPGGPECAGVAGVGVETLRAFFHEWLFTVGYPRLRGSWRHDGASGRLFVTLRQSRGGAATAPFVVPFRVRGVSASGLPMPRIDRLLVLDSPERTFVFDDVPEAPAFLDWNSGLPFYGTFEDETATSAMLELEARVSPFPVGRVEAFRSLCDAAIARGADPDPIFSAMSAALGDTALDPGVRARLLSISEDTLDRAALPRGAARASAARALRRAAAARLGADRLLAAWGEIMEAEAAAPVSYAADGPGVGAAAIAAALPRRALARAVGALLALTGDSRAFAALRARYDAATGVGARLDVVAALVEADAPGARALRDDLGALCRPHVGAYAAWLSLVASDPEPKSALAAVSAAEGDGLFRPEHPSHSRYLWGALARNNSVVWTKDGLAWLERTILRAAPVNENVAILLLSALQLWRGFEEPLRSETAALLGRIRDALPASAPDAAALAGRVRRLVG